MIEPANGEFDVTGEGSSNGYSFADLKLHVADGTTAVFRGRCIAPKSPVIVRSWLSNAVESLGEADATISTDGVFELQMTMEGESVPELACIRVESERFKTEHVRCVRLSPRRIYFYKRLMLELDSVENLKSGLASMSAEVRAMLSPKWLAMVEDAEEPTGWLHGFVVHHRETRETIGSGGFKGPPDEHGVVELAYQIQEEHRGQGYAKELAAALVAYSFGNDARVVIAHTLPESSPSTSVLKHCGFDFVGDVVDPEDGPVWRWEKRKTDC